MQPLHQDRSPTKWATNPNDSRATLDSNSCRVFEAVSLSFLLVLVKRKYFAELGVVLTRGVHSGEHRDSAMRKLQLLHEFSPRMGVRWGQSSVVY